MDRILTIVDFAKLAGVSTATVSRAFAGDPKVRQTTRDRILALAQEYHFRINLSARSAVQGKTRTVGVLLHRLTTSYFAQIAVGIQKVLFPAGYVPIFCSLPHATESRELLAMLDRRVDGLIAACSEYPMSESDIGEIKRFNLPGVWVDSEDSRLPWDIVMPDNVAIGRIAAERLLQGGFTRIGICSGNIRRTEGFLSVCTLPVNICSTPDQPLEFLKTLGKNAAVYCSDDFLAYGISQAALQSGWNIPDDLSVIGTADLNFAEKMSPPLTTIRQDGEEIGRIAAESLLKRLSGDRTAARRYELPGRLIERGSVKQQ